MTAPKRIIMDFGYTPTADGVALLETWSKPVEYTRTDLIQPMIDKAVAEALEKAAKQFDDWMIRSMAGGDMVDEVQEAIRAMIPKGDDHE